MIIIKLPNGYGTVARLSGSRRKPYIVKKTIGWNEKGQPVYNIVGYAATREEGLLLLADYNRDPWNIEQARITLQQLFDLWREKKAPKLGKASRAALCSAFRHCSAYADKPYKTIKAFQMQETIDLCGKSPAMQSHIKNLWGHLDRFALELDIISKRCSALLTSAPVPETSRLPFTADEIETVWVHRSEPWVDTVLILLYTGWRISELLALAPEDIDLKEGTMKGGTKTKAGKNRIVPIHPKIRPFVDRRLAEGGPRLICHNGRACTQDRYREHWSEIMTGLNMSHTPHECRHTFETRLDSAGANRKCIDMLMGHVSRDTGNRVYNHKTLDELKSAINLLT